MYIHMRIYIHSISTLYVQTSCATALAGFLVHFYAEAICRRALRSAYSTAASACAGPTCWEDRVCLGMGWGVVTCLALAHIVDHYGMGGVVMFWVESISPNYTKTWVLRMCCQASQTIYIHGMKDTVPPNAYVDKTRWNTFNQPTKIKKSIFKSADPVRRAHSSFLM